MGQHSQDDWEVDGVAIEKEAAEVVHVNLKSM